MSIQESETVVPFTPDKRGQLSTTPVDESGRSIVALLGRAADVAKEDCSRAMDLAHKLAFQVRAAEERAQDAEERVRDAEERVRRLEAEAAHFRDAEERVRQLDSEAAHFRDRALRAEDWLEHIHREVEQTFFQNNKQGAPPRQPRKNGPKQNGAA